VAVAVPLAAPGPELVPGSVGDGPSWLLGLYGDGVGIGGGAYYGCLCLAFVAYLVVFAAAAAIDPRILWTAIAALLAAFALAPPLLSQDVFSYISHARLGAEHGLNPYLHPPSELPGDAAFPYVGWRDTVSAYGPLFTLASYPLGPAPVGVALWTLKGIAALAVLGLAVLCASLAPARGLDPRPAAALVALNPLVLAHVVGGAHNDALMALLLLVGCAGVLSLREGKAAGALTAAAAVKVSAAFALPFVLLAAESRRRFLAGGIAALVLLGALSLLAFGTHALDAVGLAGENQARSSHYSVPSTAARILGVDNDTARVAALVLYAGLVVALLAWTARGGDWLRAAGWAALGLLLASGWLLPWYLLWVLPLAALARDRALVGLVLALTAFQLINRVPL
jgi:hypothetical protein